MADESPLMHALRKFATAMGDTYDIAEVSYELSSQVTHALDVAGAGVSVADGDGRLRFVTATSETIVEVEKSQEETQTGPCFTAFESQQPSIVTDLDDSPWTAYSTVARQNGLRAVIGYPLTRRQERLGAMNIYDVGPREWTAAEIDIVGVFADMATAYLVRVSELAEATQLSAQLQTALDSRVIQRAWNQRRPCVRALAAAQPQPQPPAQRSGERGREPGSPVPQQGPAAGLTCKDCFRVLASLGSTNITFG